eukprot:scaffold7453_cov177-Amphora_coffeaeformis.AAC.10
MSIFNIPGINNNASSMVQARLRTYCAGSDLGPDFVRVRVESHSCPRKKQQQVQQKEQWT